MAPNGQIYFELLRNEEIPFRSTITLAIQCAESCNVDSDESVQIDIVRFIRAKLAGTTRNYLLDACSILFCASG
jgi:hypothetical protein